MHRFHVALVAFVLAIVLAGCASSRFAAPDAFVALDSEAHESKFVAPDDARLWIRTFDPEADGTLAFWREHLRLHFVKDRGYTPIAEREVTIAGEPGVEFTFEATADGELQRYALFVWIEPGLLRDRVATAEYLGTARTFGVHEAAVRAALQVR